MNSKITKALLLAISLLYTINLSSQTISNNIEGLITDAITEAPIIGAEIFLIINGEVKGTVTDIDGRFKLENIPVGRHTLYGRYLGYEEFAIPNINHSSTKTTFINFAMQESTVEMEEIEVVASADKTSPLNEAALISTRTFSIEEASRFAGSFNDPSRMVQSYAGVSNANDENNEIIIRGNSPRGLLWTVEGLEIPNPNHFRNGEGGSGGAINMIPDVVLSNSDFYTGAFPAQYGNALSGVFDLKLRSGNTDKQTFAAQLGMLGLQLASEGPLSKKSNASYLFNYRYSTVTLLDAIGISFTDEDDAAPIFHDLAFKINLPSKARGKWSIYGIGGQSEAKSKPGQMFSRFNYKESYLTGVLGIKNNYIFKNNKTSWVNHLAYSYQSDRYDETERQNDGSDLLIDDEQYDYSSLRFASTIKHKLKGASSLQAGIQYNLLGFDLITRYREDNALVTYLDDNGSASYLQSHVQWLWRPNQKWTINAGINASYFELNKQFLPEPRISLQYQINDKSNVAFGTGIHSRLEPISFYLLRDVDENGNPIQRNKDLGISRAFHNVLGYNVNLSQNFRVKVEAYYQYLFDVPALEINGNIFSAINFSSGLTNLELSNIGKGQNYGVEFTVEKFLNKGTFGLLTVSLYNSQYQNPEKEWLSTRYNENFIVNLIGGKECTVGKKKNNQIGLNTRIIYHGGKRQIPINEALSQQAQRVVSEFEKGYDQQLQNFIRTDLSFYYRINKSKLSWLISLDIQNITDRDNILFQNYNPFNNTYWNTYQLGILPVLNIRVEF
ncbi:MAG: carboxypeptidase-like regulatory domain-containing protein [Bacteroidota bacterium]